MNCNRCRTEIEEISLRQPLCYEARLHIEACQACRDVHKERSSLTGLLGELEVIAAPVNFEAQLRARIAAQQSAGEQLAVPLVFAPSTPFIALAACLALTLAAMFLFQPAQSPTQSIRSFAETASYDAARRAVSPTATKGGSTSEQGMTEGELAINSLLPGTAKLARQAPRLRDTLTATYRRKSGAVFVAAKKRIDTESFSVRAAPVATPLVFAGSTARYSSSDSSGVLSPDVVPVRISPHPLQIVLRDEHGTTPQVISVESISFGAAQPAGLSRDAQLVSLSSDQGIW